MRRRVGWIFWVFVGLLIGGGVYVWLALPKAAREESRTPSRSGIPANASPANSADALASTASKPSPTPDPARVTMLPRTADGLVVWSGAASASAKLNQRDHSSREDIAIVHTMLTDYRAVFAEVPPGGLNEKITRGLLGENPKKIVFLVPKPGGLNANGELLDRWGTPYFFHKLSRNVIDLRSAGPDRKMFTGDDTFEETPGGPPL